MKIRAVFWDWLGTIYQNDQINQQVTDIIKQLSAMQIPQCIISNGSATEIQNILQQHNLDKYFHTIAGYELNLPLKPHSDMMFYCIQQTHITPKDQDIILYIGDSDTDELLAVNTNNSGIKCLWIDIAKIGYLATIIANKAQKNHHFKNQQKN